MRAYVQGLELAAMWNRYMVIEGAATDLRSVRRGLRHLREDLAAAAQRHAGPYIERCMRAIDIDTLAQMTPARLPSLEEFVFEHGLDGERQAMPQLLERLAARQPRADDPIAAWLRPELAAPLDAVGVATLRQLAARIYGLGYSWAAGLQAVSAAKARRIVAWLRLFEDDTCLVIGAHVDQPRHQLPPEVVRAVVAPATAVVPIEKFIVPPELEGCHGAFRDPKPCMLTADSDFEAMLAFIRFLPGLTPDKKAKRHARLVARNRAPALDAPLGWLRFPTPTQESYVLEIYRFMLWAIIAQRKDTSSIDTEDAAAYRDFLADPQPAATWCSGATRRENYLPAWRRSPDPCRPLWPRRCSKF